MALQPFGRRLNLFGLIIWGDFGPLTIYKNRHKKMVAYPRTYPEKPPSPLQTTNRQTFKVAANDWHHLPKATQDKWEKATRTLSLQVTGFNLYMHWRLQWDDSYVRTIERQSQIALIP